MAAGYKVSLCQHRCSLRTCHFSIERCGRWSHPWNWGGLLWQHKPTGWEAGDTVWLLRLDPKRWCNAYLTCWTTCPWSPSYHVGSLAALRHHLLWGPNKKPMEKPVSRRNGPLPAALNCRSAPRCQACEGGILKVGPFRPQLTPPGTETCLPC